MGPKSLGASSTSRKEVSGDHKADRESMTGGTGDPSRIMEGAFRKDVLGKDAADEFRTREAWDSARTREELYMGEKNMTFRGRGRRRQSKRKRHKADLPGWEAKKKQSGQCIRRI